MATTVTVAGPFPLIDSDTHLPADREFTAPLDLTCEDSDSIYLYIDYEAADSDGCFTVYWQYDDGEGGWFDETIRGTATSTTSKERTVVDAVPLMVRFPPGDSNVRYVIDVRGVAKIRVRLAEEGAPLAPGIATVRYSLVRAS